MTQNKFNFKPRKIISINYSFLISLPPDWMNHHKLNKGDSVNVAIGEKGELILTPNGKAKKTTRKSRK